MLSEHLGEQIACFTGPEGKSLHGKEHHLLGEEFGSYCQLAHIDTCQ